MEYEWVRKAWAAKQQAGKQAGTSWPASVRPCHRNPGRSAVAGTPAPSTSFHSIASLACPLLQCSGPLLLVTWPPAEPLHSSASSGQSLGLRGYGDNGKADSCVFCCQAFHLVSSAMNGRCTRAINRTMTTIMPLFCPTPILMSTPKLVLGSPSQKETGAYLAIFPPRTGTTG